MKIGIDISQVVYGTGVSVYTTNLVQSLLSVDKSNDYLLFGGALRRRGDLKKIVAFYRNKFGRKLESKIFPIPPTIADLIWNRLHVLPIELLTGKIDVFHSSDWTQPPSKAFKITTIHDLVPVLFPKLSRRKTVSTHKARLKWVVKEVDRIIVPSQTTKKDLLTLGISESRIRVIPEAVEPTFRRLDELVVTKLKRKYKISGKYLLAVGIGESKNTQRIIDAFYKARAGEDLKLIIVGRTVGNFEEKRGVRLLRSVSDSELPAFYSGAEALVYPSLYEGFGLSILQAFACGCPVVTSNLSSMPEVAGDAAVLVDPYDLNSIVEGIKEAIKNKKELIRKGFERAKEFSWEKTARETLKVYMEFSAS